jgi:HEXXH motif-containing protein
MYHVFGAPEMINNFYAVSAPYGERPACVMDLKLLLRRLLADHQPSVRHAPEASLFVDDSALEAELAKHYTTESALHDKFQNLAIGAPLPPQVKSRAREAAESAMMRISEEDFDLFSIFYAAIQTIFFFGSEKCSGGSTSNAVGVIWMNCETDWQESDVVEFLIHELAHTLLFLDERRYLHFVDYNLIPKPEYFALSAVLRTRRPIDKVLHSIVVATEVLSLRQRWLGDGANPKAHPPSAQLRTQILQSADSLLELDARRRVLTERGELVVRKTREHAAALCSSDRS